MASADVGPVSLLLVAALSLSLSGGSAAPASAWTTLEDLPAKAAQTKGDRDRDGIFDDLEARLVGMPAGKRVRVIVTLRRPATKALVRDLSRDVGGFRVKDRFELIDGFAATVSARQVRKLARAKLRVRAVEADSVVRAVNDSAQSSFGVAKARADVPALDGNADGSLDTYSKQDLVAAVIDTGVDPTHRDLDEGKVLAFKDFVNDRTVAYDDEGHGTHVAATLAGEGDARGDRLYRGVAPGTALVGVKVLDQNGDGVLSDVVAAIDWVVANRATYGIEAINLSLSAAGCAAGTGADALAVNRAHDAGLVVVAAAGNEGPAQCTIGTPAAAAKAITVGAMADLGAGGFKLASFSSRGRTLDGRIKPDVSAPGVGITSAAANTSTGYATYSGTSTASPFVAGLALLMLDADPDLSPQQVKDKIAQTALDWGRGGDNRTAGSTGQDVDYGWGRLDGYAALASAGAALSAPPPVPAHRRREGSLAGTGGRIDYPVDVTGTAFPIAATLIMADVTSATAATPNFDLYLLDPSGATVASSTTNRRQDDLSFTPLSTGRYTLRVVSQSGGGGFFLDETADTDPAGGGSSGVSAVPSGVSVEPGGGSVRGGGVDALAADDDVFFEVNSTTSGTPTSSWVGSFSSVPATLSNLRVSYRGKNSSVCDQSVSVFRFSDGAWVVLDSRSVGPSEVAISDLAPGGSPAVYVSASGELRVRVRCVGAAGGGGGGGGGIFGGGGTPFHASGDQLRITYDAPSGGGGGDTTAPTVASVSPTDGATGVAVGANASVTFSEAMDMAATQGAFSLVRVSDGSAVAGSFSWSANTLTFDPAASLAPGVSYRARVSTQARDAAGNALAAERVWTFTTASSSGVSAVPSGVSVEPGGGSVRGGGVDALAADDDVFFEVNSTTSGTPTSSWVGSFSSVPATLSNLRVSYRGKNSSVCDQSVSVFRFSDGAWVVLDSRSVGPSEVAISDLAPGGSPAVYVSASGELRVRVRCVGAAGGGGGGGGGIFGGGGTPFHASGDQLRITYDAP